MKDAMRVKAYTAGVKMLQKAVGRLMKEGTRVAVVTWKALMKANKAELVRKAEEEAAEIEAAVRKRENDEREGSARKRDEDDKAANLKAEEAERLVEYERAREAENAKRLK